MISASLTPSSFESYNGQHASAIFAYGAVENEGMVGRVGDHFQRLDDLRAEFFLPHQLQVKIAHVGKCFIAFGVGFRVAAVRHKSDVAVLDIAAFEQSFALVLQLELASQIDDGNNTEFPW